jgi:hypothetical protein
MAVFGKKTFAEKRRDRKKRRIFMRMPSKKIQVGEPTSSDRRF